MGIMVVSYLVLVCVVSFLNLFALILLYRKQLNFYFASIFVSVFVANLGYLAGALSESRETVIMSQFCASRGAFPSSIRVPFVHRWT